MTLLKKILNREFFLYYSLFYLLFKYTFFNQGRVLTYILFAYAILIFLYDFKEHKGIYKFKGYFFSYLICLSSVLSCIVVAHKITMLSISGIMILFVNFFMYLPMFKDKDFDYIIDKFELVFKIIIVYSFIKNVIGLCLAANGISIVLFGVPFGAEYGVRLVTVRETANETGWFAIFSIVSSIYFLIKYNIKLKIKNLRINSFLILNILIQFITFILSGNRSSFIGVLAARYFIFYIYSLSRNNKKIASVLNIGFVVIIIAIITYVIIKSKNSHGSEIARLDMMVYGILFTFSINPIFGSSYTNLWSNLNAKFEEVWNKYSFKTPKPYLQDLTTSGNAHNVFIQQLETNGILGLSVLIAFFIYVFLEVIKYSKKVIINNSRFVEKSIMLFFIIFGFVVGNISWTIVGTITCFVNLMFFLSVSAVINSNL